MMRLRFWNTVMDVLVWLSMRVQYGYQLAQWNRDRAQELVEEID